MEKRPIVPILIAYLAGSALCRACAPPVTFTAAGSFFFLAGAYLCRSRGRAKKSCLFLFIALLACSWQQYRAPRLDSGHISRFADGTYQAITGLIDSHVRDYGYKEQYVVAAESLERDDKTYPVRGKIQLNCYRETGGFRYGDKAVFRGRLRPPTAYYNPGGFNYRQYLARRGVFASTYLYSPKQVLEVTRNRGNPLKALIYKIKASLGGFLEKQTSRPYQRGLLRTVLLGEKSSLPAQVRSWFIRAGVAHLLSISGLHLSFIAMLVFHGIRIGLVYLPSPARLEKLGGIVRPRQLAALATLPALLFYVLLAGARTATVRALVMVSVFLLGLIIERERDLYNTLALAALFILIWQPTALLEVDFQLSFVTVFFIITALEVPKPGPLPRWLFYALLIPLSAGLSAAPLTAFHFQQVSLIGLAANIIVVPLFSLIIPLGLCASFLGLLWTSAGGLLLTPCLWLLDASLFLIRGGSEWPFASFKVFPPYPWQLVGLYLLIFTLLHTARQRKIPPLSLPAAGLAAVLLFLPASFAPAPQLRLTMLDVGQGESTLIEFPDGRNMLIDGGGTQNDKFDIGGKVVAPFLRHRRIKKIDAMVLTHPHPDHLNGLKSVLEEFEVGCVWEAPPPQTPGWREFDSPFYRRFKERAALQRVPRRFVYAGQEFSFGAANIKILHPPEKGFPASLNDQSLTFKLSYGRLSFLFTGDLTKKGQRFLSKRGGQDLAATVLKAPHHGGADALYNPFLKAVAPRAAVFSAGRHNPYRHPNHRVLAAYKKRGIEIYRTDLGGALTITSDGSDYEVRPFLRKHGL